MPVVVGGCSSGERSVRVTVAGDDRAAAVTVNTGVDEHASNGRPLLDRYDALPALVRVRLRLVRVVERFQLYDVLFVAIVVTVVGGDGDSTAAAAVVYGTGGVVLRRTGTVVRVVAASRARARAHGRVVGGRRRSPGPAHRRRHGARGQAGHGPVRRDDVTVQPDCTLGGLRENYILN